MPVAHINLLRGHERAALHRVIAGVTDAMSEILQAPKDRLIIWISEHDPDLFGSAGQPASAALAGAPLGAVELPFVQMVLMKGRPLQQYQGVMAAITEVLARELDIDKGRVRVHIAQAEPECWAIGGVPASVLRASEIAARQRETA